MTLKITRKFTFILHFGMDERENRWRDGFIVLEL